MYQVSASGSLNVNFLNLTHFYECVCVWESLDFWADMRLSQLKHIWAAFDWIRERRKKEKRWSEKRKDIKVLHCNSSKNEFREFRNENER